jgi:hypothetical protein
MLINVVRLVFLFAIFIFGVKINNELKNALNYPSPSLKTLLFYNIPIMKFDTHRHGGRLGYHFVDVIHKIVKILIMSKCGICF